MKATLYTAYHKPSPILKSDAVVPLHVGCAKAGAPLPGMVGDHTGDNISDRNAAYCELTGLYWAWKNDTGSSHIGLMHYRRVLDLAGQADDPMTEVFVPRFDVADWLDKTKDWLADADIDVVVPKPHLVGNNLTRNFAKRSQPQDLKLTRKIIAADHPDWLDDFDTVMADRRLLLGNMCLMRRDILDRYCTWMFDILEKVEGADVDRSHYNPYQSRYLGFISERLLTVFMHRLRREDPSLKVHEVHILNTANAMVLPTIADDSLNGPEHINVAFAADRAYLPHTAAMLRSMFDHAAPDRQINLFFLQTDIAQPDMDLLAEVVATRPRTALHPIAAGNPFETSYRSASRAPSNATYNRFLLFDLLPGLDRLLYVDVDMIFRGDVAEIFDTDMGGAPLGAVPDYIMTRTLTGPTRTAHPDIPDMGAYHRDTLGLSDAQIAGYFNAGLLLFNFAAIDDVPGTGAKLIKMAQTGQYLFRDQDILNTYFKDSVFRLPARFNAFNSKLETYARVPQANYHEAMAGRADPLVIHYAAGDHKPWSGHAIGQAQHYWDAIARTPFYPEILTANLAARIKTTAKPHRRQRRIVSVGRKIANRAPFLRAPLLRVYDVLRSVARFGR